MTSEDIPEISPTINIEKPKKKLEKSENSDDEYNTCSICYDKWKNSGEHRIVSLKCGHLFGKICIEKWIKITNGPGRCPQCNALSTLRDIRPLFITKLSVVDNTECETLQRELLIERKRRIEIQDSETKLFLKQQKLLVKIESLQNEVDHLKKYQKICNNENEFTNNGKFIFVSSMETSNNGGCRVGCYNDVLGMHIISKPSTNSSICPGYGVLKINSLEFYSNTTRTEFFRIHSLPIRDICFSNFDQKNMLTCSMDKTLKVTNIYLNSLVCSYKLDSPVWSCAWDKIDKNIIYAGTANGNVNVYDLRNTNDIFEIYSPISLELSTSRTPVVSVRPVNLDEKLNSLKRRGVIVCSLDYVYLMENTPMNRMAHSIKNIRGSCMSAAVDKIDDYCLFSLRPGIRNEYVSHIVGSFLPAENSLNNELEFQTLTECLGGQTSKKMSRSCIFSTNDREDRYIVAGDEYSNSVMIWDSSDGSIIQQLVVDKECVIDVETFNINNHIFLSTLTENRCSIYRWTK